MRDDLPNLWTLRQQLDAVLIAWTEELTLADLDHVLAYNNMRGVPQRKLYGSLVLNLFSHHTIIAGRRPRCCRSSGRTWR